MFEDLKSLVQEFKPELIMFISAAIMGTLQLIAQPDGKKTIGGSIAEVLSVSIMAVAIGGVVRFLGFDDPNLMIFIGCSCGLMGYKTMRSFIVFVFRGQIK